jgi:hypothetical protein
LKRVGGRDEFLKNSFATPPPFVDPRVFCGPPFYLNKNVNFNFTFLESLGILTK